MKHTTQIRTGLVGRVLMAAAVLGMTALASPPPGELGDGLREIPFRKFMAKGLLWKGINYQEANYNKICETSDGRIWFSGGDHEGTDRLWRKERYDRPWGFGNTAVCAYDPRTDSVELAFEVNRASAVFSNAETPGHGKIHSGIVADSKDILYTAGYMGSSYDHEGSGAFYPKSYAGGAILRYDSRTGRLDNLGIPCPAGGVVCLNYDEKRDVVHGLSVDRCRYWRVNLETRELRLYGLEGRMNSARDMIVDQDGGVYFPNEHGSLTRFDPDTENFADLDLKLPSDPSMVLRGHVVTSDNVIYGITFNGTVWMADPKTGTSKTFGHLFGRPDVRSYNPAPCLDEAWGRIYFLGGTSGLRKDDKKILTVFDIREEKFYYLGLVDVHKTCYGSLVARDHTLYFCVSTWETDENGRTVAPPQEGYENMYDPSNTKMMRPYLVRIEPPETLRGAADRLPDRSRGEGEQ
jgi:outer membrane protein assembly factor BamB